jgi:hypothetical protein
METALWYTLEVQDTGVGVATEQDMQDMLKCVHVYTCTQSSPVTCRFDA